MVMLGVHETQNLSSFLEVHFLGVLCYPFRSQDRGEADFIDEVVEALPENLGDVGDGDLIEVVDVVDGFQQPLFSEIAVKDALVNVLPPSLQVDQSDYVVENGGDFF